MRGANRACGAEEEIVKLARTRFAGRNGARAWKDEMENDMRTVASRLMLKGIEVNCIIGDLPHERMREQTLRVDAELELDLAKAAASDDLADSVDYAALAESIRGALKAAKCRLVERAAAVALAECMRDPRVVSAKVAVVKSGAVPGLQAAAVEMSASRLHQATRP